MMLITVATNLDNKSWHKFKIRVGGFFRCYEVEHKSPFLDEPLETRRDVIHVVTSGRQQKDET